MTSEDGVVAQQNDGGDDVVEPVNDDVVEQVDGVDVVEQVDGDDEDLQVAGQKEFKNAVKTVKALVKRVADNDWNLKKTDPERSARMRVAIDLVKLLSNKLVDETIFKDGYDFNEIFKLNDDDGKDLEDSALEDEVMFRLARIQLYLKNNVIITSWRCNKLLGDKYKDNFSETGAADDDTNQDFGSLGVTLGDTRFISGTAPIRLFFNQKSAVNSFEVALCEISKNANAYLKEYKEKHGERIREALTT